MSALCLSVVVKRENQTTFILFLASAVNNSIDKTNSCKGMFSAQNSWLFVPGCGKAVEQAFVSTCGQALAVR